MGKVLPGGSKRSAEMAWPDSTTNARSALVRRREQRSVRTVSRVRRTVPCPIMKDALADLSAGELAAARKGRTWAMFSAKLALLDRPMVEAFATFVHCLQRTPPARWYASLYPASWTTPRAAPASSTRWNRRVELVNTPSLVIGDGDHRVLAHAKRSLYLAAVHRHRSPRPLAAAGVARPGPARFRG